MYQYACGGCGHEFDELIRTAADEAQLACPRCGARQVERRPSVFAAHRGGPQTPLPRGGCGRCGDPSGPCGLD